MSERAQHLRDLRKLLARDELDPHLRETFSGFLEDLTEDDPPKFHQLTAKRHEWVLRELEKFEPLYVNLFSSGKVPRGAEVPTPPALQNLPKRPPTRLGHGQ